MLRYYYFHLPLTHSQHTSSQTNNGQRSYLHSVGRKYNVNCTPRMNYHWFRNRTNGANGTKETSPNTDPITIMDRIREQVNWLNKLLLCSPIYGWSIHVILFTFYWAAKLFCGLSKQLFRYWMLYVLNISMTFEQKVWNVEHSPVNSIDSGYVNTLAHDRCYLNS